jgi:hypothetical protein
MVERQFLAAYAVWPMPRDDPAIMTAIRIATKRLISLPPFSLAVARLGIAQKMTRSSQASVQDPRDSGHAQVS